MKEYKQSVRLAKLAAMENLHNPTVYLFFMFLCGILQFCYGGIGDYLKQNGQYMNLFELYIVTMDTERSQCLYLIGCLFLAFGMKFYRQNTAYYLIRVNRRIWSLSWMIYLFLGSILINLIFLINTWIACAGRIILQGNWSDAAKLAAVSNDVSQINLVSIVDFIPENLKSNPNYLGVITFLFSIFLALCVGVLLTIFQQGRKSVVGLFLILFLWFVDIPVRSIPALKKFTYVGVFSMTRVSRLKPADDGPTVGYVFGFLIVFLGALVMIWKKQEKKGEGIMGDD